MTLNYCSLKHKRATIQFNSAQQLWFCLTSCLVKPTQETDSHVDHGGRLLCGGQRRVEGGLQRGAPALQHVEVGLRLCQLDRKSVV